MAKLQGNKYKKWAVLAHSWKFSCTPFNWNCNSSGSSKLRKYFLKIKSSSVESLFGVCLVCLPLAAARWCCAAPRCAAHTKNHEKWTWRDYVGHRTSYVVRRLQTMKFCFQRQTIIVAKKNSWKKNSLHRIENETDWIDCVCSSSASLHHSFVCVSLEFKKKCASRKRRRLIVRFVNSFFQSSRHLLRRTW